MDNFVRIYENIVSAEKCQKFIDKFESDINHHAIQDNSKGTTLTQINLLNSPDSIWRDDANFLMNIIMNCVEKYKEDCNINSIQWPDKFRFEPPKIKRYMPDTSDEFPDHVDVLDYKTAKRFLVMFIYLSDNERGATKIQMKDDLFISSCKKGSIVIFPPMWPWLHAGQKPINEPKYIIGSYLHYV